MNIARSTAPACSPRSRAETVALAKLLRSARTLARIARDNRRRAIDLVEQRLELRFGIDLHRFDPKRRRIRAFELAHTAAPDESVRPFGNYFLDPSLLPARPVVFSLGIGEDLDFDQAVIAAYPQARMFLFDPTPRSARYFEAAGFPASVRFEPVAIAASDGVLKLYIDDLEDSFDSTTSVSVKAQSAGQRGIDLPCRSIKSLMAEHRLKRIDVFKFDVEGAGVAILDAMFDAGIWPTQIAGEFEGPSTTAEVGPYLAGLEAIFGRMRGQDYRFYRTRPDCVGWQVEFLAVRDLGGSR
jgi:FkbM family methyltransferase